jgi:hypothetical protein
LTVLSTSVPVSTGPKNLCIVYCGGGSMPGLTVIVTAVSAELRVPSLAR